MAADSSKQTATWTTDWDLMLRLFAAGLAGAAIGWEREWRQKSAGLRTHMLVSLGAAIFVVASIAFESHAGSANRQIDVLRVVQGVVGGVGFLGAGAILQRKSGVRGLTTAASIWTAAAVGVACAMGCFQVGLISVVLILVTLHIIGRIENRLVPDTSPDKDDRPAEAD